MDGYSATRQIRKMKGEKGSIPVIAMTAHVLEGVAEKCKEAGMNDYISKPINVKALQQVINKHVSKESIKINDQPEGLEVDSFLLETNYVNLEELLQLTNNNYEKIEKYIGIFFNNVPGDIESLKEAFDSENWEEMGKIAHKLKGNIGYLGVNSIKDDLLILEKIKKEVGDLEEIADIVNRVEIVVELAINELKEIKGKLKELV